MLIKGSIFLTRVFITALVLAVGTVAVYWAWLPDVASLKLKNPRTTALLERRVKQAKAKGRNLGPQMAWRNLREISPNLVHAVLLAEDDTFYHHHGFDFDQIRIAFKINWKKKRFVYGGSTLTQQLARTLYLSPSKDLLRKGKEALITYEMEKDLSKRRILEIYLNVVEWGDGVFGAEAAARHYYDKSCADLTPEESVALASILPSPRKWSPLRETKFMTRRRANILGRMRMAGYIPTEEQKEEDRTQVYDEIPKEE